ncbi:GNAT family N-acetyltransferase [Serratia ficaria]|uniref:Acetyltransferase (GNAT) family n=1 Tax=Serratia ficaria TaxID=61651 RepID=A0A240B6B8_SERFI|nr:MULTISPECIES: GNAT family N-acetyltransferase [Serratia]MEE4483167.1 GNAT family N-acetyltransferase [Serratia ficaria]REF46140.1 RimJ/RimL family protein N-acetyltransferase [Serratia ficaria]CAI0867522.1 Acetyltransferase (GNAT) family [Serratia ficaria]CAI1001456.1 Acetyltransferase (GNAT) family [Serratia ficaria]CAI1006170.1 Acetyltransferase (GNAT) family [Serratia ficaria]
MPAFIPSQPVVSARLLMRPPVAADFARYYAIYGDPQTQRFNPAGPLTDPEQARHIFTERANRWQQRGYDSWAIALREQPERVIGFGGLSWKPLGAQRTVNLGYRFDTRVWGMGLATEMALAALKFGFEGLGLDEISAVVRENHRASRRVLEKAGLHLVDTLNDVPGAAPSLVYTLMRSDYQG